MGCCGFIQPPIEPVRRRGRFCFYTARRNQYYPLQITKSQKVEELDRIIADEGLDAEATKAFVGNAFRDGAIPATGTAITKILPPVSRFSKNNGHSVKKQTVLDKLAAFFERYIGLA